MKNRWKIAKNSCLSRMFPHVFTYAFMYVSLSKTACVFSPQIEIAIEREEIELS